MADDIASLEARILSLDADTMLILGRLSLGENDDQIIAWSSGWNFTEIKIRSALSRIYKAFGLDGSECREDAKRSAAASYYQAWLDHFLASRHNMSCTAKQKDAIEETTEHGDGQMDALQESRPDIGTVPFERKPRIDLHRLAKSLQDLTSRQRELVECLRDGADDEIAAKRIGMSKYSIPPMLQAISKRVGIGSLVPSKAARLYLAAAMYQSQGNNQKASQLQMAAEASFGSSHPKEPSEPTAPRPAPEAATSETSETPTIAHVTSRISALRPRLREVALRIAQGHKNKEIAVRLGISPQSANTYTAELWKHLGLSGETSFKERRRILAEALKGRETTSSNTAISPPADVVQQAKPDPVLCHIEAKAPIDLPLAPEKRSEQPSVNGWHPSPAVSPDAVETHSPIAEKAALERYGTGVPVALNDPASIEDIEVMSGEHQSAEFAARIAEGKRRGLRPEILVLVPTTDPHRTHAQIVLIRRS